MEKIPEQPKNKEGSIEITDEQKEVLLQYLKNNSDDSIGDDLKKADKNEEQLAELLISLNLPSSDWEKNRHVKFLDSNYKEDVQKRESTMSKIGLNPEQIEITKHNITITHDNHTLHIKVIDLSQNKLDKNNKVYSERIPNSVIFFGKVSYTEGNPVYVALTEEEKEQIRQFLEEKK